MYCDLRAHANACFQTQTGEFLLGVRARLQAGHSIFISVRGLAPPFRCGLPITRVPFLLGEEEAQEEENQAP